MKRRTLIKGFGGLVGTAFFSQFLLPAKAFGWAAIASNTRAFDCRTHQYIMMRAIENLIKDQVFASRRFPSIDQLVSNDYVLVSGPGLPKTGTGPDVDGKSNYSWHYYNPITHVGLGPLKAGEYFGQMIQKKYPAHEAAWAAHFLADMGVPYHTMGMSAEQARNRIASRQCKLSEDICGPEFMYSLINSIPPGWGNDGDHTLSILKFCETYPPTDKFADWFDPWYLNGMGKEDYAIGSGSHAYWEGFWAWQGKMLSNLDAAVVGELNNHFYDPRWINKKANFEQAYWNRQQSAAGDFAAACALQTRNDALLILRNPQIGVARCVRAVMTLFRGSMTALNMAVRQEPIQRGYRINCDIYNENTWEAASDVEMLFSFSAKGRKQQLIQRLNAPIGPNQTARIYWDVPTGDQLQGTLELRASYINTPDIGYLRQDTSTRHMDGDGTDIKTSMLSNWAGDWAIEEYHLTGPLASKPGPQANYTLSFSVQGNDIFMIAGSNRIKLQVQDGGRCVIFFVKDPQGQGSLTLTYYMNGDGTISGHGQGNDRNRQYETKVNGRRIR